jgi:hypothetical protein
MTRYYFHIRKNDVVEKDPEGIDFPSADHAHQEAILAAREMLAELVLAGEVVDGQRFEICTEDGTIVREVSFKSAMKLQ